MTNDTTDSDEPEDDFPRGTFCGICGEKLTTLTDLDTGVCTACVEVETE